MGSTPRAERGAPARAGETGAFTRLFLPALAGGLMLWLAFPPVHFWPLAWVAPLPWLLIAAREAPLSRRSYAALWAAGAVTWLALLWWMTLPHWATSFGWLAISAYLGCYLPLFVGLVRVATRRMRVPLVVAAPVVWTGLEYFRSHFLTGFNLASLGHTQERWLALIQVADLGGAYLVSFLVMLGAAAVAAAITGRGAMARCLPLALAAALIAAALFYGRVQLDHPAPAATKKMLLIQGAYPTDFSPNPNRRQEIFDRYYMTTRQAVERVPDADLIVWPETMFSSPLPLVDDDFAGDPDWPSPEKLRDSSQKWREGLPELRSELGLAPTTKWLVGVSTYHFRSSGMRQYNSAALIDGDGKLAGRYDKTHPVMFGEYIPGGEWFPAIYRFSPLGMGLSAGDGPRVFSLGEDKLCPSVCYESVMPHVVHRHIRELSARGEEPDMLVNVTNDGWFKDASALDMHFTGSVFRAIECRKPVIVAANTGLSGAIDADGRVLVQGPRCETTHLVVEIGAVRRPSWYLNHGDLPAGGCLALVALAAGFGLVDRIRARRAARG